MDGNTLVIWNPNAGKAGEAKSVRRALETRPQTRIYEPTSAADCCAKVAEACRQGTELVVIAGGDGTVNSVINAVADAPKQVTLGVLPLGTANDWCSSLATPDDLNEAVRQLDVGQVREVDVVEVETGSRQTRYANIATGGNSHRVTGSITSEMKSTWGAMCYVRGAIDILGDLDCFHAQIAFDGGEPEPFAVWNILVANGRTSAGRLEVAPRASLEDGLLDVVIIEEGSAADIAEITARYYFSDFIDSGKVVYRQAREIRITSEPPMLFSIDGDMVDEQPVRFSILPRAVRVIVGDAYQNHG